MGIEIAFPFGLVGAETAAKRRFFATFVFLMLDDTLLVFVTPATITSKLLTRCNKSSHEDYYFMQLQLRYQNNNI